jgi:hypothetical protein
MSLGLKDLSCEPGLVVDNADLVRDIEESLAIAESAGVAVAGGLGLRGAFEHALRTSLSTMLDMAGPRLLQRFLVEGPQSDEDIGAVTDDEAEACLRLIRARMVNQFKGDLAELLAVGPVTEWLGAPGDLLSGGKLYWGDTIRRADGRKTADGLLVRKVDHNTSAVHTIVEVKSVRLPLRELKQQLEAHRNRIGTLRFTVGGETSAVNARVDTGVLLAAVLPASWKLPREFKWEHDSSTGRRMPRSIGRIDRVDPPSPAYRDGVWRLTLRASVEEIEAAAYAMTQWAIGFLAADVFAQGAHRDESFTVGSDDARNRMKHWLHLLGLRPLTDAGRQACTKLHNVYAFGYALSADSRAVLFHKDFDERTTGDRGLAPAIPYYRGPRTFEFVGDEAARSWAVLRGTDGTVIFRRLIRGLMPNQSYSVGFRADLPPADRIEARVEGRLFCAMARDAEVGGYAAGIGSAQCVTSSHGTALVEFSAGQFPAGSVPRRLLVAFEPID